MSRIMVGLLCAVISAMAAIFYFKSTLATFRYYEAYHVFAGWYIVAAICVLPVVIVVSVLMQKQDKELMTDQGQDTNLLSISNLISILAWCSICFLLIAAISGSLSLGGFRDYNIWFVSMYILFSVWLTGFVYLLDKYDKTGVKSD